MPSATAVARARRRSRQIAARWDAWAGILLALAVVFTLALGSLSAGMAYLYLDFAQSVPAVEDVQAFFGSPSNPGFTPIRIYDRSGDHILAEWSNPAADDRQWVSLDPADANSAPQILIQAILAAQDPHFWEAPAVTPVGLGVRLVRDVVPFGAGQPPLTLSEQVAESTLLPLQTYSDHSLRRDFRLALLGERLEARFDKEQILTWYLNSANFGSMASGADAAALVYFGKHAHDLDLAESALLAAVPSNPSINPFDDPVEAKRKQGEVISQMLQQGYINQRQASAARSEVLEFAPHENSMPDDARADLTSLVLGRYTQIFGPDAVGRGGVRIITSVDYDLQLQSECTLETHLARLAGQPPGATVLADGNHPCLAAGFLPPVRPSDSNVNHDVGEGAALVLDPASGELLALANLPGANGASISRHPAGQVLSPLIYLTAFARGYAPGSMILDLPTDGAPLSGADHAYHGPVRMRTALANVYPSAAVRTLMLVGPDNVQRTARQMGLDAPSVDSTRQQSEQLSGEASLLDLGFAYGVFAHNGTMTGVLSEPGTGDGGLTEGVITKVEDVYGQASFEARSHNRSVVSPQLAYLVDNVLSDESARWPTLGQGNALDIGRPAAAITTVNPEGTGGWTLGYTPDLTVGVWIGNEDGSPMKHVDRSNGAAPIWRALLQYAGRDQPASDWAMPPGVSQVDVCDPSGLLPTQYCPQVVREVFIQGTEPTAPDNLYQPFKIDTETGKLATLFTPLNQVEEKVFLVPPPEALAWAHSAGIDQPPQEYDPIDLNRPKDQQVHLSSPALFAVVGGEVQLRGSARADGFDYYRLQYGKGLNPDQWVQIGDDQSQPRSNGLLASWDTRGLNGLYTVQLQVVGSDGQIKTDALPLTLDNLPPQVSVIYPSPGASLTEDVNGHVLIEVEASDAHDIARVTFEIDGNITASVTAPPYSYTWRPDAPGAHTLIVHAVDEVGNQTTTEAIPFEVSP